MRVQSHSDNEADYGEEHYYNFDDHDGGVKSLLRNSGHFLKERSLRGAFFVFGVGLDQAGLSWRVNFTAPRTLIIRLRL